MRAGNLAFWIDLYKQNKNGPETDRTGTMVTVDVHDVSGQGLHLLGLHDVVGL